MWQWCRPIVALEKLCKISTKSMSHIEFWWLHGNWKLSYHDPNDEIQNSSSILQSVLSQLPCIFRTPVYISVKLLFCVILISWFWWVTIEKINCLPLMQYFSIITPSQIFRCFLRCIIQMLYFFYSQYRSLRKMKLYNISMLATH